MTTSISPLRWMLKKTGRTMVARGSSLLAGALRPKASGNTVRALTYHRFGDATRDPFCVSAKDFAVHMHLLARERLAVSLNQLKAFLAGEAELPCDAVLVTVDDGFRSLLRTALPILRDFAIPAVAFVSTGLLLSSESNHSSGDAPEPYLRWEELDALMASGISIQSHGITHRSLAQLSTQQAYHELLQSRRILEDRLGVPVDAFAYPFGTRADFNATVAGLAKDAGYQLAFTSQHGPVVPGGDLLTLSRTKVEGGETLATFAALVHGGLDAWRWIDRGLWRMQASTGARG